MNTKTMKLLVFSLTSLAVLGWIGWSFYQKSELQSRQIAEAKSKSGLNLTDKQAEKWTVVEKFNLRQNNEGLQIEIPHALDLCQDQESIHFVFKAYEIAFAGNNPRITYSLSCQTIESNMFNLLTFKDFTAVNDKNPIRKNGSYLRSSQIYTDEAFPESWLLSEIQILGLNGFIINEYEIQKVFGQNFEFKIH